MYPCIFFGVCLIILLCLPMTTGQSNLICSSQPIIALAGNDVILSCRLDPPISASSRAVEWTKPGLDPEYIHVHQDGRLVYQSQNPLYNYRTALFVDKLINGNVSMKLFRVKTSDAGKYKCFLPSLWKEAFIQLTVAAVSLPIVSLAGIDKATSGVVLQCNSTGWYPEPEVFWLDAEGKLLSAGPTETVRGPDDLYTVSSRVTVEKRHSNSFTCRVQQKNINQTRETKIHVPEDFFMAPSSCTGWTIFSGTSNQENQEISPSEDVVLEEADPDGRFLRLISKSTTNQVLGNCKIEVNKKDMVYSFPKGFILDAGKNVTKKGLMS
ncbi:butyrophilin subfamily 3 member A2-like [Pagrus major]|uniref:butyrophilin subfamily 3 member A2-like n=1 Tax=Pagrus major TaxID=143350 RepID=UPI003CC8D58A